MGKPFPPEDPESGIEPVVKPTTPTIPRRSSSVQMQAVRPSGTIQAVTQARMQQIIAEEEANSSFKITPAIAAESAGRRSTFHTDTSDTHRGQTLNISILKQFDPILKGLPDIAKEPYAAVIADLCLIPTTGAADNKDNFYRVFNTHKTVWANTPGLSEIIFPALGMFIPGKIFGYDLEAKQPNRTLENLTVTKCSSRELAQPRATIKAREGGFLARITRDEEIDLADFFGGFNILKAYRSKK